MAYGFDKLNVLIRSGDGQYVTSCACGSKDGRCTKSLCLTPQPYQASQWTLERHPDNTYIVRSRITGKIWTRCGRCVPECWDVICSDGIDKRLLTHRFYIIRNYDNGSISFKSDNGRLLQICNCGHTLSCKNNICGLGLEKSDATNFWLIQIN